MASGPETRLLTKMRAAAVAKYGSRLVVIKYHGSQYTEAGVSDLLCLLDGVFIAAEVKAPEIYRIKGEPSVEKAEANGATIKQQAFLSRVIAAGGAAGVVASVEHFLNLLAVAEEMAVSRNP